MSEVGLAPLPTAPLTVQRDRLARSTVLIAGGGNIGSHLSPLLARAGIGRIRIADRDRVEAKNLATQDFLPGDVGRFKSEALADRLSRQFPGQHFEPWKGDLEDMPLGWAAVDVLLGALDSRRARQVLVSEMAWPLGVPVVDGGVGEGLVGRVQVFQPGPAAACLECTWGREDYRRLAAEYPCLPGAAPAGPATLSTAFLGSFVAGVMATECLRILAGEAPADSYEVPFDLAHHQMRRYLLRRSPACRHDHAVVETMETLPRQATAADLLAALERHFSAAVPSLECRRGLGGDSPLGASRYFSPDVLQTRPGAVLTEMGFVIGDRIRARQDGRSMFFALEDESWTC
jgi:molybdopterin/thiamine biosynthesis adenylyltransferase